MESYIRFSQNKDFKIYDNDLNKTNCTYQPCLKHTNFSNTNIKVYGKNRVEMGQSKELAMLERERKRTKQNGDHVKKRDNWIGK